MKRRDLFNSVIIEVGRRCNKILAENGNVTLGDRAKLKGSCIKNRKHDSQLPKRVVNIKQLLLLAPVRGHQRLVRRFIFVNLNSTSSSDIIRQRDLCQSFAGEFARP